MFNRVRGSEVFPWGDCRGQSGMFWGGADTGEEVKDILGVKYKVDMGRKRRRKKKPGNVF